MSDVAQPALGPGSLSRRGWGRWAVLEAAIRNGDRLERYRRRLDRPDRPWVRQAGAVAQRKRDAPDGTDPPSAADLGADSRQLRGVARCGRFALADLDGSIFGYRLVDGVWERDSCLRVDEGPFGVATTESVKVAQISGEWDATPARGGEPRPTLSSSLSRSGIVGTDLGVRIEHDGRSLLLCGDTHWAARPWLGTRDAIAELHTDTGRVTFHGSPLKLIGGAAGRVTMREYDVPLDGFSHGGQLYAFFSSNHGRRHRVMGRSVLARLDSPLAIDPNARRSPVRARVLGEFSSRHFINVSCQLRPASEVPGCDGGGDVLLVWGTGAYRASEVRLALLDQAALARLVAGESPGEIGTRYWTPSGWSEREAQAAPLFGPAAIGELSVRWLPGLGRYLLLSASGPEDPAGHAITLRTASQPWGPWSRRLRLLDWVATGMADDPHTRFIRTSADGSDPVGDRVFAGQARGTGAAYAPYYFDLRADAGGWELRYTLSTWNPYQIVLMSHRLHADDLAGA